MEMGDSDPGVSQHTPANRRSHFGRSPDSIRDCRSYRAILRNPDRALRRHRGRAPRQGRGGTPTTPTVGLVMDSSYVKLADSESPFTQRAAHLLMRGFGIIPALQQARKPRWSEQPVGLGTRRKWPSQPRNSPTPTSDSGPTRITRLLESDNGSAHCESGCAELAGRETPTTLAIWFRPGESLLLGVRENAGVLGDGNPSSEGLFEFRNWNQYAVNHRRYPPLRSGFTTGWMTPPSWICPTGWSRLFTSSTPVARRKREAIVHDARGTRPCGPAARAAKDQGGTC